MTSHKTSVLSTDEIKLEQQALRSVPKMKQKHLIRSLKEAQVCSASHTSAGLQGNDNQDAKCVGSDSSEVLQQQKHTTTNTQLTTRS